MPLRSSVRSRTSCARCRSTARSWRTSGGDPCLRQQVGAQQLRQDRRVHLVVLQPRRGDRLALQRVDQVRLEAVAFEQPPAATPQPNAAS